MATCYHGPCDIHDPTNNNQIHWPFLLQTTQALIDTVVELSGAKCKARSIETEDNKMMKNKVSTVNRVTNAESENVEQKATVQQSYQNYRQNDKLFTNYRGRQSSNTILAYTGKTMDNKVVDSKVKDDMIKYQYKTDKSNNKPYNTEEDDRIKYQYKPDNANKLFSTGEDDMIKYQYKPDKNENMFYAGNLDNPYFTRVTVSRGKYKYLLSHCHPICDIGSIITHGSRGGPGQ